MVAADQVKRNWPVVVTFSLRGDLCFLSHHDEMRMMARTLRRADWPVAYSAGFNPQPKFTLPLPRSVGVLSDSEAAIVELRDADDLQKLYEALQPVFPPGAELQAVSGPLPRPKLHAREVIYRIELTAGQVIQSAALAALLAAESCEVERDFGPDKPSRRIDIRPYIKQLEPLEGGLRVRLSLHEQQTARPLEILAALGIENAPSQQRIHREQVNWEPSITELPRWPAAERNSIGYQEKDHAQEGFAQEGRSGN